MSIRGFLLVCCGVLLTHATAAETARWNCTFVTDGAPKGARTHVAISIDGKDLIWRLDAYTTPDKRIQMPAAIFHYSVVKNNNIGVVAVLPIAHVDKHVGTLIAADVVAIDKKNGRLRAGAVATNGVYDHLHGNCDPH